MVIELLCVHHVGVSVSVQQSLHNLSISQPHGVCQVSPYSEVRMHYYVGICARVCENPHDAYVLLSNRETEWRLLVEEALVDFVKVLGTQVS